MTSIGQTWRRLRDRFAAVGIDTAALDARLLVRHVLGIDDTGLIASEREEIGQHAVESLDALAVRRLSGEPVARILGGQEFYGLAFALNAATLVPRPETESLVDFGLAHLAGRSEPKILDLGTGTGCIAIALLVNLATATAIGVDISAQALDQAVANASSNRVVSRFSVRHGSWFDPLDTTDTFDLIVSNPPYIASAVVETLATEVRAFDPRQALDGGVDGLAPYEIIVKGALDRLVPGGALAVEIGHDQGQAVKDLFERTGFASVTCAKDLAGHDRMITGVLGKFATGAQV